MRKGSAVFAKEIALVRTTLRAFDGSLRRLSRAVAAIPVQAAHNGSGRARPRLSAKARASLVLQGRYMGFMRQLKPRQKTQVRKVKEEKGVSAAIVRARQLAR